MKTNHEVSNGSMEFGAVIVPTGAEFQEILTRFWQRVAKDFQIERPLVG